MNGLTSGKTEMIERVIGFIGMGCFFLPFMTMQIFGVSESISGFGYILEYLGEADSDDIKVILWIAAGFVAGLVGVASTYTINGTLFSGISFVVGLVCLYLLKDLCVSVGYGMIQMGTGWTLAIITYIIAAVCAFATFVLEGNEEKREQENEPVISNLSDDNLDDNLTKLRDELARYRAEDDNKK